MSKVKIQGNASGTGVLTVTAPNTSTDRVITLPDSTDTLAVNSDVTNKLPLAGGTLTGNLIAGGEIKVGTSDNGKITSTFALTLDPPTGEPIVFRTAGTDIARFRPGGGLCFGTDTAAANALDDYEEGTYAAVISGSTSGTFNMATENTLAYTKIGRLVTVQGYVGIQSGSVGGFVRLSLPFAPTALTEDADYNFPSLMIQNQGNTIAGQKYLFLQVDGYAYFYRVQDSGAANYISNSDVDGNFEIGVTFTYISG